MSSEIRLISQTQNKKNVDIKKNTFKRLTGCHATSKAWHQKTKDK